MSEASRRRWLQNKKKKAKLRAKKKKARKEVGPTVVKGLYLPGQILPYVRIGNNNKVRMDLDGDSVKIKSYRLATFARSTTCVCCGIEGIYFVKKKNAGDKNFHLELYAIDDNWNEVLMTKDHIKPRSKGGVDKLCNLQTMCVTCNVKKGNTYPIGK